MRTDVAIDATERLEPLARLEAALTDPGLDGQVEMTVACTGHDTYRATAVDGSVTFRRAGHGTGHYSYSVVARSGRDPLADQATDRFSGHAHERDRRFPSRSDNAYPHAFDSVAQFFDSPNAPDLVAVHTSHHHFDSHLGQHGSLGVVQARAPFIAAGAGIVADGFVDRSTRIVDVAPTVATVLGVEAHPAGVGSDGTRRPGALLRRQDGDPITEVLDGSRAEHAIVFLLDGCNANLLYDVIESGEAPNLAALVARGTAYRHGAMASLPTATLANHTTGVTGAHPGHTGVLHNSWLDLADESVVDLLAMDQMFIAMRHLDPSVETLYQAVERSRPGAFTTATFEFCDTGASFSSFGLLREGTTPPFPKRDEVPHMDAEQVEASAQYGFMSMVDHTSAAHTIAAWERRDGNPLPTLSWCSLALTDEAGHESGPHGSAARAAVRDGDGRVGDVLSAVERAGALERTAVFVIADHGMEQNDPDNTSSWSDAVADAGVAVTEVGESFFYLR
ncbi:MAG TPA: alkaline phosphatase family protein [Microthrixaceae bacterium]|nr:alkaline phosphatase family protein [Microthrixaceae bacterium]